MVTKEEAKVNLRKIIEKYRKFKDTDALKEEANAEKIIEDIFEQVLGWESLQDYIKRKAQKNRRVPDYTFRLNGINKFYLEAKKLSADLDDLNFQKQAVGYARSSSVSFAVLTNFEQIRVYVVDREIDTLSKFEKAQLFQPILIENCLNDSEFEKLWLLSKDSFVNRKIFEFAEQICKLPKRKEIDAHLSEKLNYLRGKIKRNLKDNESQNKFLFSSNNLKLLLDETVQKILDRLVFIRFCEDREYENRHLETFLNLYMENKHFKLWKSVNELFRDYDAKNTKTEVGGYDSGLFEKSICDDTFIDEHIIELTIKELYYFEDGTPIDFSKIPADVLGNLYEGYLSYISRNIDTQKSHRKEQGIYYTPTYVVDYIVGNTVGELLKDKKINPDNIKILDPACGSGSFLIKAYDLLEEHYNKKEREHQTQLDASGHGETFTTKTKIVLNNIFGVDLDPKAVEIAQLNLLLKIASKKERLPQLRQNIKCGNSLVDDENVDKLRHFKWEEQFEKIIQFDEKGNLKEGYGFDVVIGNPPYVRHEEIKQYKQFFEKKFPYVFSGTADLYVYFFERGLKCLKKGGYFSFIVSNKFIHSQYGFNLRKYLKNNFKIIHLLDKFNDKVFVNATVDPCIIVLKNEKSQKNHQLLYNNTIKINQESLPENSWVLSEVSNLNIKTKVEKKGIKIKDWRDVYLFFGIKSGLNDVFIIDEDRKNELVTKYKKAEELIKPILRGRDIGRYCIFWKKLYLIISKIGTDIPKYPSIYDYLKNNKDRLLKRTDYKPKIMSWYHLRPCDYYSKFNEPKIIYPDISSDVSFFWDEEGYFINDSCHMIIGAQKYWIAILNSSLIKWYIKQIAYSLGESGTRLKQIFMREVPIIKEANQLDRYVDKMLSLNKKLNELGDKHTSETAKLNEEIERTEREINDTVYKLYGITDKEKGIIEKSLS